MRTRKRRFIDAPDEERCTATVALSKSETAQCGRRAVDGTLCRQHAKIAEKKETDR